MDNTGPVVVLKYGNRKLYNTATSKYITLKELLGLGIGGFKFVDYETKQDITNEVILSAMTTFFQSNPQSFEAVKGDLLKTIGQNSSIGN